LLIDVSQFDNKARQGFGIPRRISERLQRRQPCRLEKQ
jgi:hypothetical protein